MSRMRIDKRAAPPPLHTLTLIEILARHPLATPLLRHSLAVAQRRRNTPRKGHAAAGGDHFLSKLATAEERDDMTSFVRKKRANELGGLIGSDALLAIAQAQLDAASQKEDSGVFETFASRVGRIMVAGGHQAGDLATAWDRNKHDAVTKFDFCVGLRQLLESGGKRSKDHNTKQAREKGFKPSSETSGIRQSFVRHRLAPAHAFSHLLPRLLKQEREEMENLFETLDLDKSGELDLAEARTAPTLHPQHDQRSIPTEAAHHPTSFTPEFLTFARPLASPPAPLPQLKAALRKLAKDAHDVDSAAQRHREESGAKTRGVAAAYRHVLNK